MFDDIKDDDWLSVCENTLFENHLDTLREISEREYEGNATEFVGTVLRPIVMVVDGLRAVTQQYYESLEQDLDPPWHIRFENIVSTAIHPIAPDVILHKGDFLILISNTTPKVLELKYFDLGEVHSRVIDNSEFKHILNDDWFDKLRAESKSRFTYTNCIVKTKRKQERRTWRQVLGTCPAGEPLSPSSPKDPTVFTDIINQDKEKIVAELGTKPLLILDLDFEILYTEVAYLPGSKDRRGGPVIFIDAGNPCWERTEVDSLALTRLLMYFFRIPRDSAQKLGCSIVVDARHGKNIRDVLECVGEAITLFQDNYSGSVHMAYVLVRKDSLLLLFGSSKIREKLNFEFQILSNLEKLQRHVARDQLPEAFGGTLKYNHENWIKFRTKLEPFMTGCRSAAKHAMNSMQDLSRNDLGVTSNDCHRLLDQHQEKVRSVLEDSRLTALRDEGLKIIARIHENDDELTITDDYLDTIDCVNKLFSQMNQVFDKLKVLSEKRTRTLTLCLKIRTFQDQTDEVLHWIQNDGEPFLNNNNEIGDNIKHVEKLQKQFSEFSKPAEETTRKGETLLEEGRTLTAMGASLGEEQEWVEQRLQSLEGTLTSFSNRFDERKKKLHQSTQFHELYKEAHEWFLKALRYVAHLDLQMGDVQTREGIQELKRDLDNFLNENPPLTEAQLARITQLAHHLGSKQLKMEAEQVITRCKEAEELFEKKQSTIACAENRFKAAEGSVISDEASSGFYKDDDLSTESGDDGKDTMESMSIFSWKQDAVQIFSDNDELIAAFDAQMSPKMKQRLKFIVEEMIDTEHDYVAALEYILKNYLPEMDENCPPTLAGKKNILFGNIERIHDFHKRYFSQELETFQHSPLEIGKCFLKWERQFYLYALYNKNKPKSDQLLNDYGNAYFAGKQQELNDKLNLASYLIKPVQRLGKYALLLKDMINCCVPNDPRITELKTAQDMMKFQLRHGNDLLAMDCIRECDVNLREQGCLLRQGDFIVWYGKRKKVRRVFLFEHLILFTKARKRNAQGDLFVYKHSVKNADVGLTENIGESGLKYELWYRRWRKSRSNETYVLQSPTKEVKNSWVAEIVKILWRQAQRNKEYGLTEMTTGISVESQGSGIFTDSSSTNVSSSTPLQTYIRNKPAAETGTQNVKRLSWLSGESSNSSGVFDLGGADDSFASSNKDDEARTLDNKITSDLSPGYASPRSHSFLSEPGSSYTAEALIDRPLTSVRRRDADVDPSFIRTTIYRRTLHVEKPLPAKLEKKLRTSRRHTYVEQGSSSGAITSSAPDLMLKTGGRLLNLPEASLEEEEEDNRVKAEDAGRKSRIGGGEEECGDQGTGAADTAKKDQKKRNSKDHGRKVSHLMPFFRKRK